MTSPSNSSSCHGRPLLSGAVLLILVLVFAGCGKEEKQSTRPLSESTQMLLNPPVDRSDAVLLHTIDSATEFPAALNSLEPEIANQCWKN
jgi:hypothetical protein